MTSRPPFAAKLDLVLKAMTLSRGRVAAKLGVDKSLVSRWGSGVITPSPHNLERLTALIAERRPGFSMLDWDRDLDALAEQFGVQLPGEETEAEPAGGGRLPDLPFGVMDRATRETERRAFAYEGHYRTARASVTRPGMALREHVRIRREGAGMSIRCVGGGWEVSGWAVSAQGQVYAVMGDPGDDGMAFLLLNGVTMPKALIMDGLFTTVALDRGRSIISVPIVLERIGDLDPDRAADDARVEAAKTAPLMVDPATLDPDLRARIFPEVGPTAHAAGGELFLRIAWDRSIARGATFEEAAE